MKSRQKILLEERQGRISKDLPLTFSRPIFGECLLFMEHDPNNEIVSLKKTEKGIRFKEYV